jgi:hypothetical protein
MKMAQKLKSWYVTVMEGYKQVFQKKCLSVKEARDLVDAKKKEYPSPQYTVTRDEF